MLQQMRKLSKSWVSSAFLLLLAASFGLWGIADIFRGSTDTSLASVGGTKIEAAAFQRDLTRAKRSAEARKKAPLTPADERTLAHAVLDHTLNDTALDNAAAALGIAASDGQVFAAIRSISAFQGPLGAFDEQTFGQVLARNGFTRAGFIAEIRAELTRDQLTRAGSGGVALPEGYAHAFFDYLNERRAVQYIVLPPAAAGALPVPGDAELSAYVAAHAAQFSTPEYRTVTLATIGPDDVASQLPVDDQQIRRVYELRKDSYVVPEKREIQRINFATEADAQAARAKLDAGAKFEDIARAHGIGPAELSLGALQQADLAGQGPEAFALPLNAVSQPVKYTFGWSLLRVTKIIPGATTTFEQAKPQLKAEMVKALAASKLEDIVNAFDDARNTGADLSEAAKKSGMRLLHVAAVDSHGLAPDGTRAALPASPELLQQIFKSEVGEEGDPFATTDGQRFVIRIDAVTPQKPEPLAVVRGEALARWSADRRLDMLAALAKTLAAEAGATGNLAAIATRLHVPLQTSGALERNTASPPLSEPLVSRIFAGAPGTAVFGPATVPGAIIVARISGVAYPPLPLGDPRFVQFRQQFDATAVNDIAESMAAAARARQGVTINQPQVDRIVGGEGA